ncbi:MAG: cystathionine gamma-synthase [Geodermatophilaceae bacterium]|nr:cystathionine gamma-synthase [Geodermatophilaceae bacterium]
MKFETAAIHAGQDPDPVTGSVVVPIHQTSTYAQDGVGGLRSGYEYSRTGNPTRTALETCLAALDGGARGLAFASGMAAEDTLVRTMCRPGDQVIIPADAYGGTYRLFSAVLSEWGIEHAAVDLSDLAAVGAAMQGNTKLIWCETPTNPLLSIADIAALAEIAHSGRARLVVDNTFASPYLQQPLALGADVTVYSTTKYLGGHSDVVGGAVVAADSQLGDELAYAQNAVGAIPGAFDSWLVLRGIKTLGVRMERHSENAGRIVEWLAGHPAVERVLYPGLSGHPGHDIAARQMRGFGGMVSFAVARGEDAALEICSRTKLFILAESLGGVESLIEHPGRMTHASTANSPLQVSPSLVRLSVGIEDIDDLIADLDQAFARVD